MVGALLWGLWIVLWRTPSWQVIAAGAPLGLLTALGMGKKLDFPVRAWLRWDLWVAFLALVTARVARAVATVGWAIITGRAQAGIVAVPVSLRSDMGRFLLLWAITVTPGTIALLQEGDLLYIHCLRLPNGPGIPGLPALERVLGGLWG